MKKLFLVQDADRPLYVEATDFEHAVGIWREVIGGENCCDASEEMPDGVSLICEEGELVIARQPRFIVTRSDLHSASDLPFEDVNVDCVADRDLVERADIVVFVDRDGRPKVLKNRWRG